MNNETSQLTVIIPFLNEKQELGNTLESIRKTTKKFVNILVINDNSDDNYDYDTDIKKYDCTYIKHNSRKGVAASRDEGVKECKTEYFLLLDAHMEFYEQGWDERIVSIMEENPKSLLCSNTKVLWETRENVQEKPSVFGTYFNEKLSVQSVWKYIDLHPDENICEIECIRGGAYVCSKSYWEYLHGLNGLINYGLDEELITMKVINNGGKLLLVKDWVVGHIYRSKFPYQVVNQDLIYNQLLIIELFFDGEIKEKMQQRLYNTYHNLMEECIQLLEDNKSWIESEKEYMKSIKDYSRKFPQESLT